MAPSYDYSFDSTIVKEHIHYTDYWWQSALNQQFHLA